MPELADIMHRYGPEFLHRRGHSLSPVQQRAIWDIEHCRTDLFGGHVYVCTHCGEPRYSFHSCRNRSCPKCHTDQEAQWIEAQRALLLPAPYFHTVLTVPNALHPLCRSHPHVVYGILMREGAAALTALAADPRFVGGRIGVLAVLHTWTSDQRYHPHVHMLVPGVGLLADGAVTRAANAEWLVPVDALSLIFRGKVRDALKAAGLSGHVHRSAWRTRWNTYCRPAPSGPGNVLQYLARYVFRIAITNRRILSVDSGLVVFRCRADGQWTTKTLPAGQFIGRFIQHVLPPGFTKVRYYGLLAPACRRLFTHVQDALGPVPPAASGGCAGQPADEQPLPDGPADAPPAVNTPHRCSCCGVGILVPVLTIRPSYASVRPQVSRDRQRAPP